MARIEWIRHKLENWARWCAQGDSGGLGFPSQAAFSRMAPGGARSSDVVPTSSIDAAETNEAVQSLQLRQSHLYLVLMNHYAKGYDIHKVAAKLGRAESTIRRNLEEADLVLLRWYEDRRTARAAKRGAVVGS